MKPLLLNIAINASTLNAIETQAIGSKTKNVLGAFVGTNIDAVYYTNSA